MNSQGNHPGAPGSPQRTESRARRPLSFVAPSRNTVTTIREDGSRLFLHPAEAKGKFTTARRLSAYGLIGVYVSLPWIPIDGYPALFFDIAQRRFHLFGWTLAVQDLWLMFFLITGVGFSLFFLTALLGRVWCGWACPQTVFLEHVYRRLESWIEGDAYARRALDAAPWTGKKVLRRGVKQVVFLLFSAAIAHLFLAYFVSVPELWTMMRTAPGAHAGAFTFVFAVTAALYFNFAWFREQLCIVICPYGRMQSALIDDHSLIIGYDAARGEPRGKVGVVDAGACVDCNRCVQVCPTGIDIRHGLQVECIGCAACIDACDTVMTKISRPTGLIRYDSAQGFAGKKTRWLRPRTVLYFLLMTMGSGVALWALSTLKPVAFQVTRMAGAPYYVDADHVRNQFLVRVINKRAEPVTFMLTADQLPEGAVTKGTGEAFVVGALGEELHPFIVQFPRQGYSGRREISLELTDLGRTFTLQRVVPFSGPDPELLREDANRP